MKIYFDEKYSKIFIIKNKIGYNFFITKGDDPIQCAHRLMKCDRKRPFRKQYIELVEKKDKVKK